MIKTLQGDEKVKLLSILDNFINHIDSNPNSLIARIYGIYTLRTNEFKPIDLIIMQNTTVLINKSKKVLEFDLKGSTVNRYTKT